MVTVPMSLTLGGPTRAAQSGRGSPSPGHTQQWAPPSQRTAVSPVLPLQTSEPFPGSRDGLFFERKALQAAVVVVGNREKALKHTGGERRDSSAHEGKAFTRAVLTSVHVNTRHEST